MCFCCVLAHPAFSVLMVVPVVVFHNQHSCSCFEDCAGLFPRQFKCCIFYLSLPVVVSDFLCIFYFGSDCPFGLVFGSFHVRGSIWGAFFMSSVFFVSIRSLFPLL